MLFVDELVGKDQHRERQGHRLSCPGPGVLTADEETRREKSAEEENRRRQDKPD